MTPAERDRAVAAAVRRMLRDQERLVRGTEAELVRLLKAAQQAIGAILADQPTDYERWSLPQLGAEIRRALAELGERGAAAGSSAIGAAWENGVGLVDAPLAAGGMRVAAVLPRIDVRQLQAMRAFVVDRIKDLSLDAANKITAEVGLVIIGARSSSDAIDAVKRILGESSRTRAATIVRDNLGRAYSYATQKRMEAATELLPGLQKQWRRSGKLRPRLHHDLADGQIRDVDKPFVLRPLGKPIVEIMHPREPSAPIEESINCGCTAIPFMKHWKVAHPGRTPGSPLLDNDGDETLAEILARQPRVPA